MKSSFRVIWNSLVLDNHYVREENADFSTEIANSSVQKHGVFLIQLDNEAQCNVKTVQMWNMKSPFRVIWNSLVLDNHYVREENADFSTEIANSSVQKHGVFLIQLDNEAQCNVKTVQMWNMKSPFRVIWNSLVLDNHYVREKNADFSTEIANSPVQKYRVFSIHLDNEAQCNVKTVQFKNN